MLTLNHLKTRAIVTYEQIKWQRDSVFRTPPFTNTDRIVNSITDCTIFNYFKPEHKGDALVDSINPMHEQAQYMYGLAKDINATNMLEFGVSRGTSSILFASAAKATGGKLKCRTEKKE